MRKDVKVGLAVGGILFGVVLAYALFFTGDTKDKQQVADRGKPAPARQPAVEVPPSRDGNRDSMPRRVITPPGGNDTSSASPLTRIPRLAPAGSDGSATATTLPAGPTPGASIPSGPTATDWNRLLDGSPIPALGQTPARTPSDYRAMATPPAGATPPAVTPTPVTPPTPTGSVTLAPADGPRDYVVKQGDNYWKISVAEYGSGQYVAALMQANPRYPANKLRQGVTIVVPAKSEVIPSGSPIAARTPTTRPVDTTTQYRVRSGDNLYTISKRLYGRADKAERIYELNKELIGPNPNALKLGTLLQLPEPPATITTNNTAADVPGSDIEDVAQ